MGGEQPRALASGGFSAAFFPSLLHPHCHVGRGPRLPGRDARCLIGRSGGKAKKSAPLTEDPASCCQPPLAVWAASREAGPIPPRGPLSWPWVSGPASQRRLLPWPRDTERGCGDPAPDAPALPTYFCPVTPVTQTPPVAPACSFPPVPGTAPTGRVRGPLCRTSPLATCFQVKQGPHWGLNLA